MIAPIVMAAALVAGAHQPNPFDQFDQHRHVSGVTLKHPFIPAPFRGEWNEDLKACGKALNDSALLITASQLQFWESDATVKRVIIHNNRAITVKATFAGEGQVWDADQQLVLSRSGLDLTINKDGDSFTRHRCVAHRKNVNATNR